MPLKIVSRLTGLTADIIRAWEKRYAVVTPLRGPRGARLYSSDDVARLRLLGTLVSGGRSIGDVARLAPTELQDLAHEATSEVAPDLSAAEQRIDEIVAALSNLDPIAVETLLGEPLVALGTVRFVGEIGAPLLERIGALWEAGELTVAEEHLISASMRSLFGALVRLQMPARPPTFLLTTPSGERHELGISMVTLLCVQAGMSAAYAGADLPAEDIISAASKARVSVVGLSVVSSENRDVAVAELRLLEAGLPRGVEIWLGGRDAHAVAEQLGRSRVVVLQSLPAIQTEIRRVARTELDAIATSRA